jgi:anti-sigma factor RsiW
MTDNPLRCDDVRLDLGCYVLGALDPAERIAVDEHLAHCPDCRTELAELAEMPSLLNRLSEAEAAEGLAVEPSPTMLDDLLLRATGERRRTRRRTLLSLAAVALVAVLGAGVATSVLTHRTDTAITTTVDARGVAATADLRSASHGTAIDLDIRGVRAGERCRRVVIDAAGRQQVVSEWQVDYEGTARVHATTDVTPKQLTKLRVVTVAGAGLADLPVPTSS